MPRPKGRKMSVRARRAISKALKARWAARKQSVPTPVADQIKETAELIRQEGFKSGYEAARTDQRYRITEAKVKLAQALATIADACGHSICEMG